MSPRIAVVQVKIKETSPLAFYTHCYSHRQNLTITAFCIVQEMKKLISLNIESHLISHITQNGKSFLN